MAKQGWRRLHGGTLLAPHHTSHQEAQAERVRALRHGARLAQAPPLSADEEQALVDRYLAERPVKLCPPGEPPAPDPAFNSPRPPQRIG